MQRFKNVFRNGKRYKICFREDEKKNLYWPRVDGWTQEISKINRSDPEKNEIIWHYINYFNDNKNFFVQFECSENERMFYDNIDITWSLSAWGQSKRENIKSLGSIKTVLKKAEILYDSYKKQAINKIPSFPDWKRVISDIEISYSKKQNNKSVILKINDIDGFIRNRFSTPVLIGVYDDSMNSRIIEKEYYENGKRSGFRALISILNDRHFKSI